MELPLKTQFGNPASSTHSYGWFAEELVQVARERVASLLGAEPEEIVFTSGATEANNLAIKGSFWGQGWKAALSVRTEHRAVLDPLASLEQQGADVTLLPVDATGTLSESELPRDKPDFISMMLANNETGVVHDIPKMRSLFPESLFHCDATQAPGKIPIKELGVDLLSLSAHKIYGPKGVGALYVKKGCKLEPLLHGGGHEFGLRSGTLNVPAIVGFGKACEIAARGMDENRSRLDSLTERFLARLEGYEINGPEVGSRLPGNLNLRFPGISSALLIGRLQSKIAFSTSSACRSGQPSHVLAAMGLDTKAISESIRIGIGLQNTPEELDFTASEMMQRVRMVLAES